MPTGDSIALEELESDFALPPIYVDHLKEDRDPEHLWKTQIDALDAGLLGSDHFLMVAEPGTGKTLAAEFAIVDNATAISRETSVYLVPYRPLAEEKARSFGSTIGDELDLKIESSLGGDRHDPDELFKADVIVMTYEKFDYHLRNHPTYLNEVGLVVIDEFHTLGNETRGPNLEIATTKLLTDFPDTRIVGLSATTPNANEVADWLDASWSDSGDWRQTELWEGTHVLESDDITFHIPTSADSESLEVPAVPQEIAPILDHLKRSDTNQALVFAPTRNDTQKIAKLLKRYLEKHPRSSEISTNDVRSEQTAETIDQYAGQEGETVAKLKKYVNFGIGFHHAGLPDQIKHAVVDGLENEALRCVIATTSLGAGINLPVDRVFITKPWIGGRGEYGRSMTVGEYKNLAGRAGRPQYGDDKGAVVTYASNPIQASSIQSEFIDGTIEAVSSEIDPSDPELVLNLLRDHDTTREVWEFLEDSFGGYRSDFPQKDSLDAIEDAVTELIEYQMVEKGNGGVLSLTDLGEATSKQLISPRTVHAAFEHLQGTVIDEFDELEFLKVLCASPLMEMNRLYRRGGERGLDIESQRSSLPSTVSSRIDDETLANALVTARVINQWIGGDSVNDCYEDNRISASRTPSDLRDRAAPMCARGIKTITEILEESRPEADEGLRNRLGLLEVQVKQGLSEEEAPFAEHGIATSRRWIQHMQTQIGVSHPREIIDEITVLFGDMDGSRAYRYTRKAINEFSDPPEKEKLHTQLDAKSEGYGISEVKTLFETIETEFERAVEDALGSCNGLQYYSRDESGQDRVPEGILTVLDSTGRDAYQSGGEEYRIALECKSKQDLTDGEVSADKATDIVRKASECELYLTIGTPSFEASADDDARRQGVLLMPVATFATLAVYASTKSYDLGTLAKVFNRTGELHRQTLLEILGEK
ncbi:DEAD/DEAH box helicase [Halorarius halobius]|uniref:DEAD/DEAH box helicase n=1 Tax=Halorarius halobius TaxID=2962671 RepID=UPI0020CF7FA5|nr:DEAD/DEAH box helicase [Halorarius halobius]